MKIKSIIFAASGCFASYSSAAVYTFSNLSGDVAHGITTEAGHAFRGDTTVGQVFTGTTTNGNWTSGGPGIFSIGWFNTDDLTELNSTSLLGAFTQFAAGVEFSSAPGGGRGQFALTTDNTTITGSEWIGRNMYVIVGNDTTGLSSSSEFLVLKSTSTWLAVHDDSPTPIEVFFTPGTTTLLFGNAVTDVRTTNADESITAGWSTTAPIPEPSVALLGAFGILALLRRQR